MTLLDRFRAQSRDKHSDPAVRRAFVAELPLSEKEAIAAAAREDDDAGVRKAAVSKLMDPAVLAVVARDDKDDSVRAQALAMLRDIALEAFEEVGEAESFQAIDALTDPKVLAQIAKASTRESAGARALGRVTDLPALASIARHAAVESVRMGAFASVKAQDAHDELLAIALNSDFKDTALAALELISDRSELTQVVARGRNKSAVKRARSIIREAEEQAARDAAAAAVAAAATLIPVELPEAESVTAPHGDPLAPVLAAETVVNPADAAPAAVDPAVAAEPEPVPESDEARAAREAEEQAALEKERERRVARLVELAAEAEAAAADEALPSARKRFNVVRREWSDVALGVDVDADVLARYTDATAKMTARDAEAREEDSRNRKEALARLHNLLGRVEPLGEKPDLTLKAADRALRDVKAAFGAMPPLPTKQDFEEVMKRLKDVQAALTPKVQELREADDWKRFANVAIQEQLCAKMEALKAAEDLDAAAKQVRELQEQWRASADVPRAQADTLWRRFKAAHDEVWARCEAHFAAQGAERAENLVKKTALCEQAEALSDSTDWIKTSEALKVLQAEWKTIGPVSRGREKAIWERFRSACDKFFTRRHQDLNERKTTWNENLARKEALCEKAEALAESSDWEKTAGEIRQLQAEWKTIGPVKKSRSEAIWQRFRAACDKFFTRYTGRHDTARAERAAAREAICTEVEALAALPEDAEAPADLLATARSLRARWQQEIAARGVDPERARTLDQRFASAFGHVITRWPAAFGGSDMDPESNRKRMEALVAKVEALAESLSGKQAGGSDAAASPTTRLAAMLKEALASNTIGGKGEDDSRARAAQEELRQAQSAFTRIGLVPDDARRQLTDRFQRAVRKVSDRTRKPS
ncbi:MAG: DUF349 domain-containing protein [Steroidobacteraceae bacterium]|nr:DUF349 domain-containing protein [Steroidobacteraceae bacterium]